MHTLPPHPSPQLIPYPASCFQPGRADVRHFRTLRCHLPLEITLWSLYGPYPKGLPTEVLEQGKGPTLEWCYIHTPQPASLPLPSPHGLALCPTHADFKSGLLLPAI